MGLIVAQLIKLGLPAATAWALAHLGVDPAHVEQTVNATGGDSAAGLHKIVDVLLSKVIGK